MDIIEQGDTLILEKNGKQIGHCCYLQHTLPNGAYYCLIHAFEIVPEWQRKGCGTYLLKGLLRRTGGYDAKEETTYQYELPQPKGFALTASAKEAQAASVARFFARAEFVRKGDTLVRHKKPDFTAITLVQQQIRLYLAQSGITDPLCIDATCGNGHDALFLAGLLGKSGHLIALDIQETAILRTGVRLAAENIPAHKYTLHCADHATLAWFAAPEHADVIVFNFGWLPGADHDVFSTEDSSMLALTEALKLLKPGGLLCATLYSGEVIGNAEKTAVLNWLQALPIAQYTVLTCNFANWAPTAPLPCFVLKK